MTAQDRPRFARALAILGETFNEPVSELRAEGYFLVLSDLDIADLEDAVHDSLRTKKFFPRPAELRELIEGSDEDRAELAWHELVGEVRRVGWCGVPQLSASTHAAMEALWGSWGYLCETLPGSGPELLGWMKRWKESYGATRGRLERGELIGRAEAKQILEGLTEQLPEANDRAVPAVSDGVQVASDLHGRRGGF